MRRYLPLLLFIGLAWGQSPIDTLWTKTFGDEFQDWGYGIVEIDDGYILSGIKYLNSENNEAVAAFYRTDLNGELVWEFTYGEDCYCFSGNLIETNDGNLATLIYHNSNSVNGTAYPVLIKLDLDGNIIFEKEYDIDLSQPYNLVNTSDGGYAFLSAGVLYKTDSEGEIVWSKDGLGFDSFAIIESSDGSIVIVSSEYFTHRLIKYNIDGVEFFESEDVTDIGYIYNITQTQNYFIGSGTQGGLVFWDLNGNWISGYLLSNSGDWLRVWDVLQVDDGSYYFSGIYDNGGVHSGAIGKFSLSGDDYYYFEEIFVLEWTQVLGPGRTYDFLINNEEEISMIGGYATNPDDYSTYDIWLIKLGPAGPPPPPPPPPTLVINEFLALNGNCCTDNQGDNDDYIELYNYGNEEVNIGGLYITDDMGNQSSYYQIPDVDNSTIIQPGDHLLLWADNESEQGPLHLGFKLNGTGEHLALYTADGDSLIDEISFGTQDVDIAYGRYPDGGENWGFTHPTPNATNGAIWTPACPINCNSDCTFGHLGAFAVSLILGNYSTLFDIDYDGRIDIIDLLIYSDIVSGYSDYYDCSD